MNLKQPNFAIGVAVIMAADGRVLVIERQGELTLLQKKVHANGRGRSFRVEARRILGIDVDGPPKRLSVIPDRNGAWNHVAYFFTVSNEEIQHHKPDCEVGRIILSSVECAIDRLSHSWHQHVLRICLPA